MVVPEEMDMVSNITRRRGILSASNSARLPLREVQVRTQHLDMEFCAQFFIDIYCYQCNDAKEDPNLAVHLASFGINVQTQTKTEKSMTELVRYSFSIENVVY